MPPVKGQPETEGSLVSARNDPFTTMKWWVEIDNYLVATFAECSGLTLETEYYEYREGGLNRYARKFPGPSKYSNLILKRGMGTDRKLWTWYTQVVGLGQRSQNIRKTITIRLFDTTGQKRVATWSFIRAFPVKWVGPEFRADSSSIAIETLEFAHEGLTEIG